jgi:hypothetical protein
LACSRSIGLSDWPVSKGESLGFGLSPRGIARVRPENKRENKLYQQHQYFPQLVFDGRSRFPLAAWLRPGAAAGACGALDALRDIVTALRGAWPDVPVLVRGDSSLAGPALYEFCEAQGLLYAFGYASNAVLKRRTERALWELELYHRFYRHREPHVQRFQVIEDYQAESWSRPRRVVCKVECTPQGSQRRFVVTNLSGQPAGIYRGFYVARGEVPEQPIDELKNGLDLTRLSAHGFRANAYRLLLHVVAYGLVVLLREAAAAVPEVARATVGTLRGRLWKVAAWVEQRAGGVWFHVAASWPGREVWTRTQAAVEQFTQALAAAAPVAAPGVGMYGSDAPQAAGPGCGGEGARRAGVRRPSERGTSHPGRVVPREALYPSPCLIELLPLKWHGGQFGLNSSLSSLTVTSPSSSTTGGANLQVARRAGG